MQNQIKRFVKFGTLSVGEEEATLSMKFDRDGLDLQRAAATFCGTVLQVRIRRGFDEELPGVEPIMLKGRAISEKLGVTKIGYAARLEFALGNYDLATLAAFSKAEARLECAVERGMTEDD